MEIAFFVLFGLVFLYVAGSMLRARFAGEEVGTLRAKYASPLGEERLLRVSVRRSVSRGSPLARVAIAGLGASDWTVLEARDAVRCAQMLEAAAQEASP